MAEMPNSTDIRRILLALDSSSSNLSTLQTATNLAARLKAELLALFIEDKNLLDYALLPIAREMNPTSAISHNIDSLRLQKALTAQASELQRVLTVYAEKANIQWSFKVTRGQIIDEVLSATQHADLLVLCRTGYSSMARTQLGNATATIASSATRSVLVLHEDRISDKSIFALFEGGLNGMCVLSTAAQFASSNSHELIVLINATAGYGYKYLQRQVTQWLEKHKIQARVLILNDFKIERIVQAVQYQGCDMLVISADSKIQQSLGTLIIKLRLPVAIVRQPNSLQLN